MHLFSKTSSRCLSEVKQVFSSLDVLTCKDKTHLSLNFVIDLLLTPLSISIILFFIPFDSKNIFKRQMSSTKQRKCLNNFDIHETLYQINLSFEDYKYCKIHSRNFPPQSSCIPERQSSAQFSSPAAAWLRAGSPACRGRGVLCRAGTG